MTDKIAQITEKMIAYDKGDVPRIELFARSRAPGWDVWGNEAVGSIQGWPPQENLQEVS